MTVGRLIFESIRGLVEWLISPIPGPVGYAVRWLYYRLILAELGKGTLIDVNVRVENPSRVRIGRNSWIDRDVILIGGVEDPLKGRPAKWVRQGKPGHGELVIGDHVHIASSCVINGLIGVSVGSRSGIASGTKVHSLSHHHRNSETGRRTAFSPRVDAEDQFMIAGPVTIGENSGVGSNCVVLPGTILEAGSFLAVGSVLRGATEPNAIYSGVPAKKVG